jgi:hypothetical protein
MTTAYRFVLSLVVPVALWLLGMVPSIPLTLTVAVIMVLGAEDATARRPSRANRELPLPTFSPKGI